MLGSGEVARAYQAAGTRVSAFVQFDMTAFVKKGTPERVGIVTDFVHPSLSGQSQTEDRQCAAALNSGGAVSFQSALGRRVSRHRLDRHAVRM